MITEKRIEEVKKLNDLSLSIAERFEEFNKNFFNVCFNAVPLFTNMVSFYKVKTKKANYNIGMYNLFIVADRYTNSPRLRFVSLKVKNGKALIFQCLLKCKKDLKNNVYAIDYSNPDCIEDMNFILDSIEQKANEIRISMGMEDLAIEQDQVYQELIEGKE